MRITFFKKLLLALVFSTSIQAAKDPELLKKSHDFTQGDTLPANASHDWNLGPLGARGWCLVSGPGATGSTKDSRQILITSVSPKGPSHKLLKKGDVIIGLGEENFTSDARLAFAKALSPAQASPSNSLTLLRHRDGANESVTILLPKSPAFSPTAPFDCAKSAQILKEGCDNLATRGLGRPSITSHINALALLATGDRAYKDVIEELARKTTNNPLSSEMSLACWSFSFANIFLCEYYLSTKDKSVLNEIRRLSGHLVKGQGPLGTWGHTFLDPTTDRLRGYGAVNAVGVPCAIALVLTRECGQDFEGLDPAIEKTAQFFRRHVGLGAIPYGDGPPNLQYGHDDNGKNSAAAILYSLLGDKEATRYYTQTAIACHGADREQGHTGNFFNMLWSLPAVSLGGPQATGAWLNEFGWYYDLAQDPDYLFPYQGYPRQRQNSPHANWDCPGAYLLHYAIPLKKLRITGRDVTSQPQFTPDEIADSISAGAINYRFASLDYLREGLSSWSPVVRHESARELRRRKTDLKSPATLTSDNPLDRIAALRATRNFKDALPLLKDPDLRVRVIAITSLSGKDKPRALEAVFQHLAETPDESPVFTQAIGNTFFPLGVSSQAVGKLLNAPKDRESTIKAIDILLEDEDALVSSRVAMGLRHLPKKELYPILPRINQMVSTLPEGNVMFANKLRVSCAETLAHLKLEEGLNASASLLADMGWGKNNRLPQAARLLIQYKSHAHPAIPQLKAALNGLKGGGDTKWKQLLKDTIAIIEAEKPAKSKLTTIDELTK